MQPLIEHEGIVIPLNRANIDTDMLLPKQYLKSLESHGFGGFLFDDERYLDPGEIDTPPASRRENPAFILNREPYRHGSLVLAQANFGCGSSREHAPWALTDLGLRAIVSSEIADIFRNNSLKNGLLPIVLPEATIDQLFNEVFAFPGYELTIDLERQVVLRPQGEEIPFDVIAFRKYCLLNGFDDIGLTMRHSDKIKAFEAERLATKPWLAHTLVQR